MRLLMHVLRKNKKLNIDNTTLCPAGIILKLREEQSKVIDAILNYLEDKTLNNLKEIIRETFDLIQICILILWKCHRIAKDLNLSGLIEEINIEHKDKLSEHGWIYETGIGIDIKE